MGNEKQIEETSSGTIGFTLDNLPVFIIGKIIDNPGTPIYPFPIKTKSFHFSLKNPDFEQPSTQEGVTGWMGGTDKGGLNSYAGLFKIDKRESHSGKAAGQWSIPQPAAIWQNIHQRVSLEGNISKIVAGETLRVSAQGWFKLKNIEGRGVGLVCSFYNENGTRFSWMETRYRTGTRDWFFWETGEQEIPDGTKYMTVDIYAAPGTTGQIWIDDIQMNGSIWGKSKVYCDPNKDKIKGKSPVQNTIMP
jgi:hypothetical protein